VRSLADRVLTAIRKRDLLHPGDRVAVAVSGGADSVALLVLLAELRRELGIVLSVAHVNHKLRGAESDEDEHFVADLARQHKLEFFTCEAPVEKIKGSSIEAAARKRRYEFFRELTQTAKIGKVATAHTLDDQAETVLLRTFRGTGIHGLAGIHPRLKLGHDAQTCGEVIRLLLAIRRKELREFLRDRNQPWREDSSNQDPTFLRNKLRMSVLPALRETFGEAALENLADLAEIARAEDEATQQPLSITQNAVLDLRHLLALPLAAQRRAMKAWIETTAPGVSISFRLVEEILDLVRETPGRKLELAPGRTLRIMQNELRWEPAASAEEYEYPLPVPGVIDLRELNIRIETSVTAPAAVPQSEHGHLLDPEKIRGKLRLRNWRPGDRYWPANRKEGKKVKELLTDRHGVGVEKKRWPVVEANGQLIWLRGFPTPQSLQPKTSAQKALWIRELPRNSDSKRPKS
jgi:tRNA(Ile)-lysidine synthase